MKGTSRREVVLLTRDWGTAFGNNMDCMCDVCGESESVLMQQICKKSG